MAEASLNQGQPLGSPPTPEVQQPTPQSSIPGAPEKVISPSRMAMDTAALEAQKIQKGPSIIDKFKNIFRPQQPPKPTV